MIKRLELENVLAICYNIGRFNWAMKAFGALLESADLEMFFRKNEKGEAYRKRLNLIITLLIDHQEDQLHSLTKMAESGLELEGRNEFRAVELVNQGAERHVAKK